MRLNVEQPESVNEGEDVEKPKDERAPVQRLVMRRGFQYDARTIAPYSGQLQRQIDRVHQDEA